MPIVVHVILTGVGGTEGWLDIDRDGMTVCKQDQGKDIDLVVQGDTGQMYKWLAGILPFRDLVGSGLVRLIGPKPSSSRLPDMVHRRTVRRRTAPLVTTDAGPPRLTRRARLSWVM
ncbi:MAG TPA: hypothetical protein VGJ59_04995 [Jatrophihabitantaceae bacterium]